MAAVREGLKYVERADRCQPGWLRWVDSTLTALLPARCLACALPAESSGICTECRIALPWCAHACQACGLPLPAAGHGICGTCLARAPVPDHVIAALWYRFPVREWIGQFKFRRHLAAGAVLGDLLVERLLAARAPAPDALVPVPLHGWRLSRRGFNQAFEIARAVARQLGLRLRAHDLRRTRSTRRQAGLDARDRRRNLERAFAWRGPRLTGQHLVLVDDVMTTGTTLRECALTLRQAGAGCVDAWVLARAARP